MTKTWLKTCVGCEEVKPLEQFYRSPNSEPGKGYSSRCPECTREYQAAYRAKLKKQGKKYYVPVDPRLNRSGLRPNQKAPKWAEGIPAEEVPSRESPRRHLGMRLWRNAKAPLLWYELRSAYGCEICGASKGKLVVDHDHSCCPGDKARCGKCNRGVLCGTCNTRIGVLEAGTANFEHSNEWLTSAEMYLQPGYQTLFHFLSLQEDV